MTTPFILQTAASTANGHVLLAPYAAHPAQSRGRRYPQPDTPPRHAFERDRDRIVHCSAFRRLVYKTQVFLNHEGDLFRTRMTHSLEVAQLSRAVARRLRLQEDLAEALALAHDLGHTPFGHAGQDALNDCMTPYGGFEHNLQSLRVVDVLEQRYASFDGLNLTFETREGILKHCAKKHAQSLEATEPNGVAARFLNPNNTGRGHQSPTLEAQLCNLCDNIAYNAHDVDDGVRSGLITLEQLDDVPLWQDLRQAVLQQYPQLTGRRLMYEVIRLLLHTQVDDVCQYTQAAIDAAGVASVADVRLSPTLVRRSADWQQQTQVLQSFLMKALYRHPQVMQTTDLAKTVVHDLFNAYLQHPSNLPQDEAAHTEQEGDDWPRRVADYIAGMTDRFAIKEHERLTGQRLFADHWQIG